MVVGQFFSVPTICFDRQHHILSSGQRAGYGSSMSLSAAGVANLEGKLQTLFGDWSYVLRSVEDAVFDHWMSSQRRVATLTSFGQLNFCSRSNMKMPKFLGPSKKV